MPKEESTSKYVHEEKFMFPFIIYADMESLPEEINTCHNNPKKPSATKKISMQLLFIYYLHIVYFMTQETSIIITEAKLLELFERACKKNNQLLKKRNDTIDNRRN